MVTDLASLVGSIDIYLFDQLLRGRIPPGSAVFDAGCGQGRNLIFFLRAGYDVSAVDPDADAIRAVRVLAVPLAPWLPALHLRAESLVASGIRDRSALFIIIIAVLYFARDEPPG